MQTGSLTNYVISQSKQPEPFEGMPATMLFWTDRAPATVIEVQGKKTIVVQEDNAERVDDRGMSESQDYVYSRNFVGPKFTYTLRKNGSWVRKGEPMKRGQKIRLGDREKYHDFSF